MHMFLRLIMTFAISLHSIIAIAQENEENVSKVAGQIVPDGDRNQYYLDYKRWNISTNPFGLIYGSYSLSGSYAIHKNFALKGDLNFYDYVGSSEKGTEVSLSVPIYFKKVYSGFFLDPGFVYKTTTKDRKTKSSAGPQVLVGYSWMWDSGLNVAIAAGVSRNVFAKEEYESIQGNSYLRIGYAF